MSFSLLEYTKVDVGLVSPRVYSASWTPSWFQGMGMDEGGVRWTSGWEGQMGRNERKWGQEWVKEEEIAHRLLGVGVDAPVHHHLYTAQHILQTHLCR